jgi:rfaE bifunctional protein kinase chain/domain
MKYKQAIIWVSDSGNKPVSDLENACSIAFAVSNKVTITGSTQYINSHVELINKILNPHKKSTNINILNSENSIKIFDELNASDDVQIIILGDPDDFNRLLNSKIKQSNEKSFNWSIVNATRMKFDFLESNNDFTNNIPLDTLIWIQNLLEKFSREEILNSLNSIKRNNVLVLGENIIDEYHYCDALGKVSKDPLVAFRLKEKIVQHGGSTAVAKHLAGLGAQVRLFTTVGEKEISFIKMLEGENFRLNLIESDSSIIKTRFVDRATNNRVFESYQMPNFEPTRKLEENFLEFIETVDSEDYSIVVMDYGHGLIDSKVIKNILGITADLSVNTQSNAGNLGFNSITKYVGSKRVFLNGSELRQEYRNQDRTLEDITFDLADRMSCEEIFITAGADGILCWTKTDGMRKIPGFAPKIIDRVGAGDSVLSVITLLRQNSIDVEICAFFGNIAGAILVGSMGNSSQLSVYEINQLADKILKKVI